MSYDCDDLSDILSDNTENMGRREDPAWTKGIVGLTAARERGDVDRKIQSTLSVTRSTINRLGLEKELNGHMGCVNCLEWNHDGSVLASASDDLHVILWDPYRHKLLHNFTTGHTGNIFSVKFISHDVLATCAADGTVRVANIHGDAPLVECSCHCGRVKRLATAPDNPYVLWSAAEDGLVLQHDTRTPHSCSAEMPNVLVNLLSHLGRYAEAKCLAVNPQRPYQLAVGANDYFVRLYDTRMIKLARFASQPGGRGARGRGSQVRCALATPDDNLPRDAVQYFAPGHLSMEINEQVFPKKASTYVAFNQAGTELLVNLGSEQIYLFDINSGRRPALVESFIIQHNHGYREEESKQPAAWGGANGTNGTSAPGDDAMMSDHMLSERVRDIKEMANSQMHLGKFAAAVELYNRAALEAPRCALLYSNRAAALMRRGWSGDTYAAIRDCYHAIKLDSFHVKSHFRLAKGLMDLKRAREAHECLMYFKDKFPRHAASHAVFLLQKDVRLALNNVGTQPDEVDMSDNADDATQCSALERQLRGAAVDYSARYAGHCNTTTDIKEVNFLGPAGEYLAAGSDDGCIFIWCRRSGNVVRCLRGDDSIVNCVQPHPATFLLASSGIEAVVRLWSPRPEDGTEETRLVQDHTSAAMANQQRMRSDPFEAMLLNISFAGANAERDPHPPTCRPT